LKDVKGEFGATLIENVVALAVIALASVMMLTLFGIVFSGKNNNTQRAENIMQAHSLIDELTNGAEGSNSADAGAVMGVWQGISHRYPQWEVALAETGTPRLLTYRLKTSVGEKEEAYSGKLYISPSP
jgi:type II secretory pathway pseudopilin PulG